MPERSVHVVALILVVAGLAAEGALAVGVEVPPPEPGVGIIRMVQPPGTGWVDPIFVAEGLHDCSSGVDYSLPPGLWVGCKAPAELGACHMVEVEVMAPPAGLVAGRARCGGELIAGCAPGPDLEGPLGTSPFYCQETVAGQGAHYGACNLYPGFAGAVEPIVLTCTFRFTLSA